MSRHPCGAQRRGSDLTDACSTPDAVVSSGSTTGPSAAAATTHRSSPSWHASRQCRPVPVARHSRSAATGSTPCYPISGRSVSSPVSSTPVAARHEGRPQPVSHRRQTPGGSRHRTRHIQLGRIPPTMAVGGRTGLVSTARSTLVRQIPGDLMLIEVSIVAHGANDRGSGRA